MTAFVEVARDVFVLRYPVLDVNVTLVVGDESALVVDTLSTDAQAAELLAAVRHVTTAPLRAVNTHHHFDHSFGNATLAAHGARIWGHEAAVALLAEHAEELKQRWYREYAPTDPGLADGLVSVTVRPPDHAVRAASTLDLGGRTVVLRHLGRGHTAGDLVVEVPDAAVVIAGDLVEESGPPQFDDAYPLDWPDTLAGLLTRLTETGPVVPGHGAVVDAAFVREQHQQLTALDWLIREGDADGAPIERVAKQSPFDLDTSLIAVRRGYDQLTGKA
jgi:glyoxylase-like metal-dependent hydrolase (beta-lactamase superfamily II)